VASDPAIDRELGRVARGQNGVITRDQLLALGVTAKGIRTRLRRCQLQRLHRGVYAIGDPALLTLATKTAAVLAIGPGAVLSHRSAAVLWSLAKSDRAGEDVTLPRRQARPRERIKLHRVTTLDKRDITRRFNIPVTTAARTVVDFAAQAGDLELERALAEGIALRHFTETSVRQALARAPANHPGAARVKAVLNHDGLTLTRSDGERVLRKLLREAGLPQPLSNVKVRGFEIDLYWPEPKFAVELDGFDGHRSRAKFESDRRRDQVLAAAAIQSLRVTGAQLKYECTATVVRIAQAMVARGA
jgi:very-short-patch-repair endonuclease